MLAIAKRPPACVFGIICACTALLLVALPSHADDWPQRPIKIVVPYAPGGAVDIVARLLELEMGKNLNASIAVENHTGGAGIPAAEAVVRAAPDGYTLGLFSSNYLSNAVLHQLSFDVINDITPVSIVVINTVLILVPTSSSIHSLADLVAQANSGKLSYGTPGYGTAMYFAGELLKSRAKINMVHVPYRGAEPALTALLGDQIPVAIMGIGPAIPYIRAGKLRALAITTEKRSAILPDIPTVAESGYPGFGFGEWFAMFGPKGLSPEVLGRLHAALVQSINLPAVAEKLRAVGLEPTSSTPSETKTFFTTELERIRAIAAQANPAGAQ
jgi:tripartite-type tricarboxylate transporter receptor subunit TctC